MYTNAYPLCSRGRKRYNQKHTKHTKYVLRDCFNKRNI